MDLKQLKSLLKVLKDNGVTNYKTSEIELQLLPEIKKEDSSSNQAQTEINSDNPYSNFPDGELSQEQLMFYSAGGLPENDPENDN